MEKSSRLLPSEEGGVKPGDLSQAQSTPAPVPEAQTVLTHVTGVNDWSPAPEVLGLQLKELRRDAWGDSSSTSVAEYTCTSWDSGWTGTPAKNSRRKRSFERSVP